MFVSKFIKWFFVSFVVVVLTACGGGSSGSSGSSDQQIAISKVMAYADDQNQPVPSVEDYEDAGVVGVTAGNLDDVNDFVAGQASSDVETTEEIQAILEANGLIPDTTKPVITLGGNTPINVTQGTAYNDAGATAQDNVDGDITGDIVTVNPVNTNTVGQYTVTYNVSDTAGNAATQVTRTVNVVAAADTTKPVITLLGNTPINVTQGTAYNDAGATAQDNVDGDITGNIVTVNPVDTNTVGQYTVTYNVSDTAGNAATQVTRTVNVVAPSGDTTKPVITLLGNTPIDVTHGTAYTDAGATALDDVDGDITGNIVTVNPVDTNTVGQYTVTYNVSDAAGNAATQVTRTVNVVQNASNTAPVANAGPDQIVVGGNTEVTLDGSDSSDVDGDDLSYSWILTVPTGSTATLTGANNVDPTFTPDVNGTYIAQLRVNDGTTDSVLDTVAILYSTVAEPRTGGICITFDDAYVDSWYATRNLFDQYHAKVTFNLSWWEVLTEAQKQMLRDLKNDGHEIASHSLSHADISADPYNGDDLEIERYIKDEVDPAIELMATAGLPPVTFAVPYNYDLNPNYIDALLEKFTFVRTGVFIPHEGVDHDLSNDYFDDPYNVYVDNGYYTCQDQENDRRHVKGFTGALTVNTLKTAMDHAKDTNSVVMIYDHNIVDVAENYSITRAKLEEILQYAQSIGLKFYTRIELQKPCLNP